MDTMNEDCATREMPRYRCHKTVHALKIKDVVLGAKCDDPKSENNNGARLVFEEQGYQSLWVSAGWFQKHDPQPGGYYVVYDDGYKSYSPAKAFEDGYTLIKNA